MLRGPPPGIKIAQEDVQALRGSTEIMLGRITDGQQTPCNTGFFVLACFQGGYSTMRNSQPVREVCEERVVVHTHILSAFKEWSRRASSSADFFRKR